MSDIEIDESKFEDNLKNLEALVKDLESEQFSLDESLKKFESGVALFKLCKEKLDNAEKKVLQLSESLKEDTFEL